MGKLKAKTPEEIAAKRAKRKARKAELSKKTVEVDEGSPDQEFISKAGKKVKLLKFIKPSEIWVHETKRIEKDKIFISKKRIITYDGIKRLAKEGGIYNFTKAVIYSPSIENRNLHAFDVTVFCNAGLKDTFCLHGFHQTTMLGEASDLNTKSIGLQYKPIMAEKRGYVRSVINHLGLVDILGEEEITPEPEIQEGNASIERPEFEALAPLLNKFLAAETDAELRKIWLKEVGKDKSTFTQSQLEYITKVCKNLATNLQKGFN